MNKFFEKYRIFPNHLFVDRIYVIIDIDEDDNRDFIDKKIDSLLSQGILMRGYINYSDEIYGRNPYKEKYIYKIPQTPELDLSIYKKPKYNPKAKIQGYIKFDFMPKKILRCNRKRVKKIIREILPFHAINPFDHAWASKIEITTDQVGITPNDFLVRASHINHSKLIFDDDGNVATIYCGRKNSKFIYKGYNKIIQIRDKYDLKKAPNVNVARHEITLNKVHIPLSELYTMTNHFQRLYFYDTDLDKKLFSPIFRRLARSEGLPVALAELKKQHIDYTRALEKHRTELLDVDKLWDQWPHALKFLSIFKGDPSVEEVEYVDDQDDYFADLDYD